MDIQNRIKGLRYVKASELAPNSKNWRKHPPAQQNAMTALLHQVGWVSAAIYNLTTETMLDGHLRQRIAKLAGDTLIPVLDVELSEEEERLMLLSFDPIASMADSDISTFRELMQSIQVSNEHILDMFTIISNDIGALAPDFHPATNAEQSDINHKDPVQCPHCGKEFVPNA